MDGEGEQEKIKRIRDYVLKTGFPSEIEVGNVLRKRGWLVVNQYPYTCQEEGGKIRTADLFAMKVGLPPPIFGVSLLIECKKSAQHEWVFHTQRKVGEFYPAFATLIELLKNLGKQPFVDKLKELSAAETLSSLVGMQPSRVKAHMEKLSGLHVLDEKVKIGVLHVTPSKKDDFFEATQQINSALHNLVETAKSTIVFPTIVFDGELFEFYEEGNEFKVFPINHVQYTAFGKDKLPFLIDVVRKSYFSEFVTIVERDFQIFKEFAGGMGI